MDIIEEKNFKSLLNEYINLLNCSAKELSRNSLIPESVISRYRTGEKVPKSNSKQVNRLIEGIVKIANQKQISEITLENVTKKFNEILNIDIDYEKLRINLNLLIECLNINVADLSRYLGYDPSYISKIRSGTRKPIYVVDFISSITKYVISKYDDNNSYNKILELIGKSNQNIVSFELELKQWLCTNSNIENNDSKINHFLNELNNFNLDDYIKVIHFDELKTPTLPITLPKSKNYYGLEEMKQGELEFFKMTILSKSSKNVFMCSDMPMEDLTKDVDFGKKWMLSIAILLKKGVHLDIIHNLNRSFNEMMLGLECWIPIYMTGQVTPYYIKNYANKVYSHLNYVSNDYALVGECISDHHNNGKYYLTSNKKEVKYYKEKATLLLNQAISLMEIYTKENIKQLNTFYKKDMLIAGNRKRVLSGLPTHTISSKLLNNIIDNNKLSKKQIDSLKKYINEEKKYIDKITKDNLLIDEITLLDKEDFNKYNISINLGVLEDEINLTYTYENYLEHFNDTQRYKNKNYKLLVQKQLTFNNIDIYINSKKYVVISKKNNPNIHFVIKHEKLVNAIENFIPLVVE